MRYFLQKLFGAIKATYFQGTAGGSTPPPATNRELREDGGIEIREDGGNEERE